MKVFAAMSAVLLAASVQAQGVSITPIAGVTIPLAGELLMWKPMPPIAGYDSVALHHRYEQGRMFGVVVDFDRPSALDFSAQFTVNLTERTVSPANELTFGFDRTQQSVIYGLAVMARGSKQLGAGTSLFAGIGPELLYMTGAAVSNEGAAPPPQQLEIHPRYVLGGYAKLGVSQQFTPRLALRLQAGFRYFAPTYRTVDPSPGAPVNRTSEPFRDLTLTLGASLTRKQPN